VHEYARWKYILLVIAAVIGTVYALPSLYGDTPSVQISLRSGDPLPAAFGDSVAKALGDAKIAPEGSAAEKDKWLVRLGDEGTQLRTAETLKRALGTEYVVALNLAPKTPAWLDAIGARPMARGLDLRGGVHFLMEVDASDVRSRAMARYLNDVPALLRKQDVRYTARRQQGDAIVLEFADAEKLAAAQKAVGKEFPELALTPQPEASPPALRARLSDPEVKRIVDFAVSQNITTLRNRVNELGVAEPLVQRQGATRILVQLPGVQDTTRVKDLLGATATLEYRAVDLDADPRGAVQSGIVPAGDELFYTREGRRPYLLRKDPIVTGDQLVDADSTFDQQSGGPAVAVTLDAIGAKHMLEFTGKNVGKPMAVLFRETVYDTTYNAQSEPIREKREVQDIINVATIRGVFGKRFITTGVSSKEAHDLSILLRAGALVAPIAIVEERTVGPSLGADNIKRGFEAAAAGLSLGVRVWVAASSGDDVVVQYDAPTVRSSVQINSQ